MKRERGEEEKKGKSKGSDKKGSPYSITQRRVPELIPVLGSQPAGDVSHKPGVRLPLKTWQLKCNYFENGTENAVGRLIANHNYVTTAY